MSNNLILLEELDIGHIDALVLEENQAKVFVTKYSNLRYFLIDHSSHFAIALKKNSSLTKEINNAIAELKKNGVIEKIKNTGLSND